MLLELDELELFPPLLPDDADVHSIKSGNIQKSASRSSPG